ncbi:MAG: hypothetical protein EOP04_03680 [Proteobacteria bacterium]|nr:MAG: hypothetical protein EOP04_03680 [Pseudomonadota bacterium]
MKPLDSFLILNEIKKLKPGTAFSWRDLSKTSVEASRIRMELARLRKEGKIERKVRGVYFIPHRSWAGPVAISDEAVVQQKLTVKRMEDKKLYGIGREGINRAIPYGLTLFNAMGLTTQVAARKEYVSSIGYKAPTVVVKRFQMELIQDYTTEEAMAFFALASLKQVRHEDDRAVAVAYAQYLRQNQITHTKLKTIASHVGGVLGRSAMVNLGTIEA